jgi:Protein of unknown function (DUF3987)
MIKRRNLTTENIASAATLTELQGKPTSPNRKLASWVETFVEHTASLNNPAIFRRWTAIAIIAAVLEQKVWMFKRKMYPNLYVMLVGHPGIGKTRTIAEGRQYLHHVPDFHLAPISMTFASLVDSLVRAKRNVKLPDGTDARYNSLAIMADELGAFMHKYDNEMVDGLSAFYDTTPYQQTRRTNDINIKITSPQINLLCGSTPQNLTDFLPEKAWGQGFCSRMIMIFSDERIIGDDWDTPDEIFSNDLANDLAVINTLVGEFEATKAYQDAVNRWREAGELPVPNHPKLIHYVTRRRAHLYKLSMVAAVDRSNALILTYDDFVQGMKWLLEAEAAMVEIFKAGSLNADAAAMDEIVHFVMINDRGQGVNERAIIGFARDKIPLQSILKILDIMVASGQLILRGIDRATKLRYYSVARVNDPEPET